MNGQFLPVNHDDAETGPSHSASRARCAPFTAFCAGLLTASVAAYVCPAWKEERVSDAVGSFERELVTEHSETKTYLVFSMNLLADVYKNSFVYDINDEGIFMGGLKLEPPRTITYPGGKAQLEDDLKAKLMSADERFALAISLYGENINRSDLLTLQEVSNPGSILPELKKFGFTFGHCVPRKMKKKETVIEFKDDHACVFAKAALGFEVLDLIDESIVFSQNEGKPMAAARSTKLKLDVFSVHLSWGKAATVVDSLRSRFEAKDGQTSLLIAGDFNTEQANYESCDGSGKFFSTPTMRSLEKRHPENYDKPIDHVVMCGKSKVTGARALDFESQVNTWNAILAVHEGEMFCSDHIPIMAMFRLDR